MNLNKIIFTILEQDTEFKGKGKSKTLIDAIKQRHPVTFYYTGPKAPPRDAVKSGTRVRAEIVALGLSKKGNLIVRAWVQPPSISKKGFNKHGWRTFMVSRMGSIRVLTDETFDTLDQKYNPGKEDTNGPMQVTYVTSDWTQTPEPETEPTPQPTEPQVEPTEPETEPTPQPEPTTEPEVEPTTTELPQPKKEKKPSLTPQTKDYSTDVYNKLQPQIKDVDGYKSLSSQDYQNAYKELYNTKRNEWINTQKELGKNTTPGEGTRRKFDVDTNDELSNLLSKNNIRVQDEEPNQNLAENIKRIKTLMLS